MSESRTPHQRGALIERVAKALCCFAHPDRSLGELVSPSRQLWMRFIPEAEVAVQAMDSIPSETGFVQVPVEDAKLIRKACLPLNPNKTRGWHPDLLAAVRRFIAAVEGK